MGLCAKIKIINTKASDNLQSFFTLNVQQAAPSLTRLVNLISVNQTLCRRFVCGVLLLLLVEEHQEGRCRQRGGACSVALVQLLDLSPPGGGRLAFLHLPVCTQLKTAKQSLLMMQQRCETSCSSFSHQNIHSCVG